MKKEAVLRNARQEFWNKNEPCFVLIATLATSLVCGLLILVRTKFGLIFKEKIQEKWN